MSTDMEQARALLDSIFGDLPTGQQFGLWWKDGLETHCFTNTDDAVQLVEKHPNNVYIHLAGQAEAPPLKGRFSNAKVSSVYALGLDIDFQKPGSTKNYPPDQAAAAKILKSLKQRPTFVIHSGGGLHAWYAFKEPEMIEGEADRARVSRVFRGFQAYAQEAARKAGNWDIDAIGDLARVLRLPGTWNAKAKPFLPVKIISQKESNRYNFSDLEEFLESRGFDAIEPEAEGQTPATFHTPKGKGGIKLFPDKLAQLLSNRRAAAAWRWTPDNPLKLPDGSISAYVQVLADIAASIGWTDQEIADLIFLFQAEARPKHPDPKKRKIKTHSQYYKYSIENARKSIAKDRRKLNNKPPEVRAQAKTQAKAAEPGNIERLDTMSADEIRATIAEAIKVPMFRIYKFDATPPTYAVEIKEGQRQTIGEAENIISQAKFRTRMYELGVCVPPAKREDWFEYTRAFLKIEELIEMPPESRSEGQFQAWLIDFLQFREWTTEDPNIARREGRPLQFDGALMEREGPVIGIHLESFLHYLQTSLKEKNPKRNAIMQALHTLGCRRYQYQIQSPKTSISLWVLPGPLDSWTAAKP